MEKEAASHNRGIERSKQLKRLHRKRSIECGLEVERRLARKGAEQEEESLEVGKDLGIIRDDSVSSCS